MSFASHYDALRKNPETARAGTIWTKAENKELMNEVMDGMDFDDIAKKHQRTISGIKARVMSNALIMIKERDLPLQYVANLIHISAEELENYKQTQDNKVITPKVKKTISRVKEQSNDINPYREFMNILTEIRDSLKIIAEK